MSSRNWKRMWPFAIVLLALVPAAAQAADGSTSATLDFRIWEMIRASGLIAYVLLSVSVFVGIGVRVRALDWLMKRSWVLEGHQTLSVLALAFTVAHVVFTLFNRHVPFSMIDVIVPFASGWRPVAITLGIIGFYLLALLAISSWLRPMIGQKLWRSIHYGGFVAWVVALGHSVFSGTDTTVVWVQWLYLLTATPIVMLITFRALTAGGGPTTRLQRQQIEVQAID